MNRIDARGIDIKNLEDLEEDDMFFETKKEKVIKSKLIDEISADKHRKKSSLRKNRPN